MYVCLAKNCKSIKIVANSDKTDRLEQNIANVSADVIVIIAAVIVIVVVAVAVVVVAVASEPAKQSFNEYFEPQTSERDKK